jgi:hypothetical protein
MRKNYECEGDNCRDPHGGLDYVITRTGEILCVRCYLVFDRGMDAGDAYDLVHDEAVN